MADAYKLKADASFPQALLEDEEGNATEVVGRNYAAGSYVLASNLTKQVRDRAEAGDLDHLLEAASTDDYESSQLVASRVFIPEHEAEAVIFQEAGKEIVPRDQVVELNSAGADTAAEKMAEAYEGGADERPNLTAAHVVDLAANERGEVNELGAVPEESEKVDEERLVGVERPPGVQVGPDKAAAEGDENAIEAAQDGGSTPASSPRRRGRPRKTAEEQQASGSEGQ